LQETHSVEKNVPLWKKQWGGSGQLIFSHGTSGSTGVATIIHFSMNYKIKTINRSLDGRYLAIHLDIDEIPYCIINCYAPNTNNLKKQLIWLEHTQNILQEYSDSNIIIGGDLNDVFIPMLDRYKCKPGIQPTEYVKAWLTICEEQNLSDFWRILNPNTRKYTWRQGSSLARLKQSRLDYWIVSTHMMYNLEKVDIENSIRSDHSAITINFYKNQAPERGPSFWHFNASLLKDKKYVAEINNYLNLALEKYKDLEDKGLKWDLIKMEIRSSTICFSKNKAKETRDNIKQAMITSVKLEKLVNEQPTDKILKEYQENKLYVEQYNKEKANGALMRSKVNWAEFGEKNSKFFLNLEKRNHKMKCITKLIDDNEKEITDPSEILKYEKSFYNTLYSAPLRNDITHKEQYKAKTTFIDKSLIQTSINSSG
jgi:exonuclease III